METYGLGDTEATEVFRPRWFCPPTNRLSESKFSFKIGSILFSSSPVKEDIWWTFLSQWRKYQQARPFYIIRQFFSLLKWSTFLERLSLKSIDLRDPMEALLVMLWPPNIRTVLSSIFPVGVQTLWTESVLFTNVKLTRDTLFTNFWPTVWCGIFYQIYLFFYKVMNFHRDMQVF